MKPRLLSTARLSFPLASAIAALLAAPSAHAATLYWDGAWATETVSPNPGFTVTVTGNDVKYTFPTGTKKFARLKVTGP